MKRAAALLAASACFLAACGGTSEGNAASADNGAAPGAGTAQLSLTRLDCGSAEFKDKGKFFSDTPGIYPPGPGSVTDSCYLIRHGDQQMLWDTGFPAKLKGSSMTMGDMTAKMSTTLAEQLAQLGLKPADIDIVGISHMHGDHTGQAAAFPQARLVIGKGDFEQSAAEEDPFGPWRGENKPVNATTADVDIFGDGSVVALHMPGHTPDHLTLLVNLASGPVLLSGDLYQSTLAREKRTVPPFNTDKAQTLASMDKFEALAKEKGAKVIIQHEQDDIAKLPAFPKAAE